MFIAGTAAASAAKLVVNGSFESTSLPGRGTFAGNVASWSGGAKLTFLNYPGTASTACLDVYDGFPAVSPDGGNFAQLDGHRGFGRDDEQRQARYRRAMSLDTPTIRRSTADDLADLHPMVERAYRGDAARLGWTHEADYIEGPRTSVAALAAVIADPNQAILLACGAAGPEGCVQVTDNRDGSAGIGLLSVEPARQASGLGRRLLAAAEAEALHRGAQRVQMSVVGIRDTLIAYYERRGYRQTGERRPFGYPGVIGGATLDFVILEKPLKELSAHSATGRTGR